MQLGSEPWSSMQEAQAPGFATKKSTSQHLGEEQPKTKKKGKKKAKKKRKKESKTSRSTSPPTKWFFWFLLLVSFILTPPHDSTGDGTQELCTLPLSYTPATILFRLFTSKCFKPFHETSPKVSDFTPYSIQLSLSYPLGTVKILES